ncbi:MAG: hypothetical protein M1813_008672 [Trichoglossum hirsutum]|nr:MAG: hypothetical protein M1813_008672 [Trichoglossum hirsutum]
MQVPPRFHRAAIRIEKLAAAHVVAESDAITPGQSSRRAEKTRERFRAATNALELQQKIFTSRTEASGRRQAKADPTRELLRMGRRMTRAIEELVRVECRRSNLPPSIMESSGESEESEASENGSDGDGDSGWGRIERAE